MNGTNEILVIGGGASGLAAALAAAQAGGRVTVLERLDRIGKKLLATGNGRCNITNKNAAPEHYRTWDAEQLAAMMDKLPSPQEVLTFFEGLGLLCSEEDEGRVYPYCRQASMVIDVLRAALSNAGVQVECDAKVRRVTLKGETFTVSVEDGRRLRADHLILAAGGQAAPQLGTDGSAFTLAKALGHTVQTPYPCLVPLRCKNFPSGLKGLRINGELSLWEGSACVKRERGEVQITEYGFSGIPAMQLSGFLVPGAPWMWAEMDFFPDMREKELYALLAKRRGVPLFGTLETLLLGLISKKAGYAVLKRSSLSPLSRPSSTVTDTQLAALVKELKGWRFAVSGALPWAQAQTTGGGVPLKEVDAGTCASCRCPGLYLTGELLDAAGECGGYNLQWAWSTGLAAGRAAALGG